MVRMVFCDYITLYVFLKNIHVLNKLKISLNQSKTKSTLLNKAEALH